MSTENHKPHSSAEGEDLKSKNLILLPQSGCHMIMRKKSSCFIPPTPTPYSSEQYDQFLNELQDPAEDWILFTVEIMEKQVR